MPRLIRIGVDQAKYHGYQPLGTVKSGSTNVITNGCQTARVGDPYTPKKHKEGPEGEHTIGKATGGSPDVFINGRAAHRNGDSIACGTVANNGSPDVILNEL
jgi:uncharacterized Zn-binding protein involved in type VI secretion